MAPWRNWIGLLGNKPDPVFLRSLAPANMREDFHPSRCTIPQSGLVHSFLNGFTKIATGQRTAYYQTKRLLSSISPGYVPVKLNETCMRPWLFDYTHRGASCCF